MPRSRGSEMPQRQYPRGPQLLRALTSNPYSLHDRPITDGRSPKMGDRKSPKSAQSDSLNQKKFGTRIAGLESQLGQAQEELKILKYQLASAKIAKKESQEQLEEKAKKPSGPDPVEAQDEHSPIGIQESNDHNETDVFEVPMEEVTVEPKAGFSNEETKAISISIESPEPTQPTFDELALKNEEKNLLKAKLEQKEKELQLFDQENESLKNQLNEAALERSACQSKEEEMNSSLRQLGQQLKTNRSNEIKLKEKLEAVEGAKEALETEMKKLGVQTEHWRKVADAAATVLGGGVEVNGRRTSERCGFVDKHFGNFFEPSIGGGYMGFIGSPDLGDDLDGSFGSEKRKVSGIRMFGDLWKKRGQK